jgi:hypothetical protein
LSDEQIRANWAALEDAIARNHEFPGSEGSSAGEHTIIEIQDNGSDPSGSPNMIKLWYNSVLKMRIGNGGVFTVSIPSDTKMYFYENAAPTGWTYDSAVTDKVLAVKGGSQAYNRNGGGTAGTWTQPNHTHTGPNHTHSGPSHSHGPGSLSGPVPISGYAGVADATGLWTTLQTNNTGNYTRATASPTLTLNGGASAAAGNGNTGSAGTGSTGNGATAATYRPAAAVGIICQKD